ncbi:MAG: autotransporter-associated beta strand repeat-containing protein [Betaproteobacteria bacterium]|nr:autotransporter-associated beta strand repeat-containing protein [Betaproteobacteria bacterium]
MTCKKSPVSKNSVVSKKYNKINQLPCNYGSITPPFRRASLFSDVDSPALRAFSLVAFLGLMAMPLSAMAQRPPVSCELNSAGVISGDVYGNSTSADCSTPDTAPNNNHLKITDSDITDDAYGGYAESAGSVSAEGNWLTVEDWGHVNGYATGGGAFSGGGVATVRNNTAVIDIDSEVFALIGGNAFSANGDAYATGNAAIVDGGEAASVIGGIAYSEYGSAVAENNSATAQNGADIYISDVIGGDIWIDPGAPGSSGTATLNIAVVNSSDVAGGVAGATVENLSGQSATATKNVAIINAAEITGHVAGAVALSGAAAAASDNHVVVNGGTLSSTVSGGEAVSDGDSAADENSVEINNAAISVSVFGGAARGEDTAASRLNKVVFNDGSANNVFGGRALADDGVANATGNEVTVRDATIAREIIGGDADGLTATASGNMVNVANATVAGANIRGGLASSVTGGTATASGNTVTVTDSAGNHGDLRIGGFAITDTGTAIASGNQIFITNSGGVNDSSTPVVAGGNARASDDFTELNASNNEVTITSGSDNWSRVYGGLVGVGGVTGDKIEAINNTVNIVGHLSFAEHLAGGFADGASASDTDLFSGNTLNVRGGFYSNGGQISNFERVNFFHNGEGLNTYFETTADKTTFLNTQDGANAYNFAFGGTIGGNGNIVKQGAGSLTVNWLELSAGDLTVSGGILNLGHMITNDVSIDAGATLNLGSDLDADDFAAKSVNVGANATLGIHAVSGCGGGSDPCVFNADDFTFGTGAALNITGFDGAPYDGNILTSGTTIIGTPFLEIGGLGWTALNKGLHFLVVENFAVSGGNVELEITDLAWDLDSADAHGNFTIDRGEFVLGAVLADNGGSSLVGWDGKSLTKGGTGTLILTGANTYTGDTNIGGGKLAITGALGGGNYASDIFIGQNGILELDQSAAQTLGGTVTGEGGLIKKGSGTLTLGNAGTENTYAGGTWLLGGEIVVGKNQALGTGAVHTADGTTITIDDSWTTPNDFVLLDGATTFNIGDANNTLTGVISGEGGLTKTGSQTLTLGSANTYKGTTTVTAGTLAAGAAGAFVTGDYVIDGTLDMTGNGNLTMTSLSGSGSGAAITLGGNNLTVDQAGDTVYHGAINGSGGLVKDGVGNLSLTNSGSDYSGGTLIKGGLIHFYDTSNFGTGGKNVTLDGGGIKWSSSSSGDMSDRLNDALGAGGGVFDTDYFSSTLTNDFSGQGGITKDGGGSLTLAGNNSFTGALTIKAGDVSLTGDLATGSLAMHALTAFDYSGATAGYAASFNNLAVTGFDAKIYGDGGALSFSGANLNFAFTPETQTGDTFLTVEGASVDISGSTVGISLDGAYMQAIRQAVLIDAQDEGLTGAPTNLNDTITVGAGFARSYDFTFAIEENQLLLFGLSRIGGDLSPQAKAFSEGHLADMVLLNRGGNMVAGAGMAEAIRVGRANRLTGDKGVFGVVSGGTGKYKTGSHVDMDSFSLMAGVVASQAVSNGEASAGAFFEYGDGSYDTYNKFPNAASVKGDGKNSYYGAGLLGNMDVAQTGNGNVYVEGSLRAGKIKNRHDSNLQFGGQYARVKTDANYYSLHAGTGYRMNLGDNSAINLYGQFFHTNEGGDSVTLSDGQRLKFSSVNSNRIRMGGRYEWTQANVTPYAGIAYEYEFDGKAKATLSGDRIDRPDMKGSSGIVEGGFVMKPAPNHPLSLNVGLQGYFGKMEGWTGSLRLRYDF